MTPVINDTDFYVFRIDYVIIRRGDRGKELRRERSETYSSIRPDGSDMIDRLKARFGQNTEINSITFIRQYDPNKEYERMAQVKM